MCVFCCLFSENIGAQVSKHLQFFRFPDLKHVHKNVSIISYIPWSILVISKESEGPFLVVFLEVTEMSNNFLEHVCNMSQKCIWRVGVHIISYHVTWYHIISYHIIGYDITWYCAISYVKLIIVKSASTLQQFFWSQALQGQITPRIESLRSEN